MKHGDQELKQLKANFLLDAAGRNKEVDSGRLFDATLVTNSPKKIMGIWTNKF